MIIPVIAALAVVLLYCAMFAEARRIRVTRVELAVKDLHPSLQGLTICHLSDMHVARYGTHEKILHRILSGLHADICAITGDMVCTPNGIIPMAQVLNGLTPRLGILTVPGNGEHKLKISTSELSDRLREAGVKLLVNSHESLDVNGARVNVVGVDDPFGGFSDPGAAMSGMPRADLTILMAHSPDILVDEAVGFADLILAGHTHGGQIRLPFIGALWLHCRYRLGISDGYFSHQTLSRKLGRRLDRVQMYVSRGTGTGKVYARFLCPPEVVLITLVRKFHA